MKKNSKGEFRPSVHTRSNTHGFSVIPNPYENRWDHIPVKETTQRLININKNHRKRNKQKLCFSTSTRSIPMRAIHKPPSRPSSAPVVSQLESFPQNRTNIPTPPAGGKTNYATRKIRSAVPRVNVPDKPPEPEPSPAFDLTRTSSSLEMKVQIEDTETKERLEVVEAEKSFDPNRELEEEIKRLKQHIEDLENKFEFLEKTNKEKHQLMQIDFNKNLAQTLNEKKRELRRVKEMHYSEISALKHKMNDALKMQRNESSFLIAKLKGEIDSNRETHKYSISLQEKLKMEHSEQIQDLQSDLFLKHQSEKTKLLRDLEERLTKEKELALQSLKSKLEADLTLLRQQHTQEMEEILHTFEGISIEEVDSNRATIQEQELQLLCYKRSQKKLEEEIRSMMNELASHKTALKQLQESFFDKVNEVDAKYTQQLSSLLIDNKDLRKRYLKKCDELFSLKAAYNRLQEAKGYIAKEMLSALMQGKQPHVITSSAVKASWSSDGLDGSRRCSSVARSVTEPAGQERSQSACSVEDPAALMLSTCSYIQDNSSCTRNPRPLSENMFSREGFPFSLSHASSEGNLSTLSDSHTAPVGRISRVKSTTSVSDDPPNHRKQRPVSSVCVVRPHSRQSLEPTAKPRATSADPRSRVIPTVGSEQHQPPDDFNLPALPLSPKVKRNDLTAHFADQDPLFLEYDR